MPRHRRPFVRLLAAAVGTALLAALPVVTPRPLAAVAADPAVTGSGYWLVGSDGSVYSYGAAGDLGSLRGTRLTRPVVGMAPTPSGAGYWMVGSDGGIFSFGDAAFFGSTGDLKLNQPIVGMAATPSGQGYWFVAADGGIFSFGDAAFHGSTGAMKLNKPIVGMAATPTGNGYWFVASDGGIFSFGDAAFFGSTGAMTLARPIVGMAATPSGQGYWFVASDGGIFNFGDAGFLGSAGGHSLPAGIVVMSAVRPSAPTTVPTGPTGTTGPSATTTTTVPSGPRQAFEMGIIGDTGYRPEHHAIFDSVVADMNSSGLAFVTHAGDFKDPTSACTDKRFEETKTAFNKSTAPFVYAIGDNEWIDCGLSTKEPKDPIERLATLRQMFFPADESLGVNRMPLTTQRQGGYPENTRWTKEGVVFATLNAPGDNDNLPWDVDHPDAPEAGPRRLANVDWLNAAFDEAEATDAPGVMIIWQANPWEFFAKSWTYLTDVLRERTVAFGKPVVLVHGDTHIHRIDKGGRSGTPLDPKCPPEQPTSKSWCWSELPNFTRVETYAAGPPAGGAGPLQPEKWLRATVDPNSPQVFSFVTESVPVAPAP